MSNLPGKEKETIRGTFGSMAFFKKGLGASRMYNLPSARPMTGKMGETMRGAFGSNESLTNIDATGAPFKKALCHCRLYALTSAFIGSIVLGSNFNSEPGD